MEVLQGIVDALTGKVTDIEVPAEAASMSSAVISAPKADISTSRYQVWATVQNLLFC